jgi:hypothetical protein
MRTTRLAALAVNPAGNIQIQFPLKLLKLHTIVWNETAHPDFPLTVHMPVITPLFFAAPNLRHLTVHGGYTCGLSLSPDDHPFGSGPVFSSLETLQLHGPRIDVGYLAWILSQTTHLRKFSYSMSEHTGSTDYDPEHMGKALLQVRETLEDVYINRSRL